MIPRRRPKLNACECGRAKNRTDKACTRCAEIEAREVRQVTVGQPEKPIDYHHATTQAACTRFFRDRGINESELID